MSYQPYYIASFDQDSGLNTYYEPFLIPEKAFPKLEDCVCYRGRVKRRPGMTLLGRLRRVFAATAIANISSATVSINLFTQLGITGEPNAQIEPKTIALVIAAPISQTLTDVNGDGTLTIAPAGIITAANINYNTGILSLTFSGVVGASAATLALAYFPGLPVMGLRTEELIATNEENTVAFDTKYAYQFDPIASEFEEIPYTTPVVAPAVLPRWQGTNSDFFWTTNYQYKNDATNRPLFWVTNSNKGATPDPIRYYDTDSWYDFAPKISDDGMTQVYLEQAQIILPYKNRLLFMNTWEGTSLAAATQFPQRIRWSWIGDVLAANAFREDIQGAGDSIDAPTNEVIISAEFVKDTLLIKFERSSWKLIYTGNESNPFLLQKINTELGAESKFSLIPFDRGVFSVGNYGITTDDSVNVERIDVQIPDTVFDINNDNQGVQRVYGIRDFANEMAYWAFPTSDTGTVYPNRVLAYNYRNQTYSIFNDSFTCYGYFQYSQNLPWSKLTKFPWAGWSSTWSSGILQSQYPLVAVGNQHGFVSYIDKTVTNDFSLYIKSINFAPGDPEFTVPNHNLRTGDIVFLDGIVGGGTVNPSALNGHTYQVSFKDANTIILKGFFNGTFQNIVALGWCDPGSLYFGAGEILKINGLNISTKIFAPFYEAGSQCRLGYVDYLLDKTTQGQVTADLYVNENSSISMTDSATNTSLLGSSIVYTKPENTTLIPDQPSQKKIWHRQFIQSIAQNFQIVLSMTPEQLADISISNEDVILHALAIYLSQNSRLTQ